MIIQWNSVFCRYEYREYNSWSFNKFVWMWHMWQTVSIEMGIKRNLRCHTDEKELILFKSFDFMYLLSRHEKVYVNKLSLNHFIVFCDSPMRSIFPNPTPPYVTITIWSVNISLIWIFSQMCIFFMLEERQWS